MLHPRKRSRSQFRGNLSKLTHTHYVCFSPSRKHTHSIFTVTYVHAGSPSSCVCTACSSTPRLSAVCPCDRPPERGRLSEPEPPGLPPAALPPPPESSGGPPDSPHSQLQHRHKQVFAKDPSFISSS